MPFSHGFVCPPIQRGPHICQIYTAAEERMEAVYDFMRTGLQSGAQTYCISQKPTEAILDEFMEGFEVPPAGSHSRQLHTGGNRDFYLRDGAFDPHRVLAQWDAILAEARGQGSSGIWAIADVLAELSYLKGGTQLVIYESKLQEWMHDHQATIVCQYDARVFDTCTIMNVLKVHPLVLANGRVAVSPFFAQADKLKSH
jgi:hypothetical protein